MKWTFILFIFGFFFKLSLFLVRYSSAYVIKKGPPFRAGNLASPTKLRHSDNVMTKMSLYCEKYISFVLLQHAGIFF